MSRKWSRIKQTQGEKEAKNAKKETYMREHHEKKLEMVFKEIPIEEEPQPSIRDMELAAQREWMWNLCAMRNLNTGVGDTSSTTSEDGGTPSTVAEVESTSSLTCEEGGTPSFPYQPQGTSSLPSPIKGMPSGPSHLNFDKIPNVEMNLPWEHHLEFFI